MKPPFQWKITEKIYNDGHKTVHAIKEPTGTSMRFSFCDYDFKVFNTVEEAKKYIDSVTVKETKTILYP